jgi:hypothetical protein
VRLASGNPARGIKLSHQNYWDETPHPALFELGHHLIGEQFEAARIIGHRVVACASPTSETLIRKCSMFLMVIAGLMLGT